MTQTRAKQGRARRGAGLAEMLVALVIAGFIGAIAVRGFMTQMRMADEQYQRRAARRVARAPVNLLQAELRMVPSDVGVAAASAASGASSISARVPVAAGIVCGAGGGGTVLSLLPTDSLVLAQAALSGYAYRSAAGTYVVTEGTTTVTTGGNATCTAASITTVSGGRVVTVTPAFPAAATAGTPAFLHQRVRYAFGPSQLLTGRRALFRTLEATNVTEELAAPYDTASRFRFFRNDNDTSDVTVPPLSQVTGVELVFVGASESTRAGRTTAETATLRTAVMFTNRP